jgi:LDH2 family malate/lactate/ureidoglycolate dehydrogenase
MGWFFYKEEDLKKYIVCYFKRWGVPAEDARLAAEVLVSADTRGVDSHGIIRLNSYYGSRLRQGLIDPLSPITTLKETPTTLSLDGGNGLGHPVGVRAMRRCIEKAESTGLAMVTVRNSNHYGIAGYYAMMALPHDMIGLSFTNSGPLVAPTHGRKAMLGTNPIAVAVPAFSRRPFVLDMATSIVPIGRVSVYQKEGRPLPAGWGIDKAGKVTEDPQEVISGGALMPLGGPEILRGYKGYGLALMVDIFSGGRGVRGKRVRFLQSQRGWRGTFFRRDQDRGFSRSRGLQARHGRNHGANDPCPQSRGRRSHLCPWRDGV